MSEKNDLVGYAVPAELTNALDRMFFSIVRVNLEADEVQVLYCKGLPERMGRTMDWQSYLEEYSRRLTPASREKALSRLSAQEMGSEARSGCRTAMVGLSYQKQGRVNWLNVNVVYDRDERDRPIAYLYVRKSNEEHLLRSIVDQYVYNRCDYFIYLDAKSNSYTMFSGIDSGTPLPPVFSHNYEAAMTNYVRTHVASEDQERVIQELRVDRVLEQLDRCGVHTFYCGVMDAVRGYARKQLTYQYYDRENRMVLLSRTDVTGMFLEEQARQEELRQALERAKTDALTGLLNYGGMEERVSEEVGQTSGRAAFLFFDLDNFKLINDTLGHQAGDRLLRRVGEVLRRETRERDVCGRIGGDEFVVYLRDIRDREQAQRCAGRICQAIAGIPVPDGPELSVSCSMGVAVVPEDGQDYRTLYRCADRRSYRAKSEGKNRYYL